MAPRCEGRRATRSGRTCTRSTRSACDRLLHLKHRNECAASGGCSSTTQRWGSRALRVHAQVSVITTCQRTCRSSSGEDTAVRRTGTHFQLYRRDVMLNSHLVYDRGHDLRPAPATHRIDPEVAAAAGALGVRLPARAGDAGSGLYEDFPQAAGLAGKELALTHCRQAAIGRLGSVESYPHCDRGPEIPLLMITDEQHQRTPDPGRIDRRENNAPLAAPLARVSPQSRAGNADSPRFEVTRPACLGLNHQPARRGLGQRADDDHCHRPDRIRP